MGETEAMRLWELHVEVAKPTEVQRLGVRFINRITMAPQAARFDDYIQPHPETQPDRREADRCPVRTSRPVRSIHSLTLEGGGGSAAK